MTTIAFLGAGSVVFTRQLLVDILGFDELVVTILLGPDYRAEARQLAPMLILASILMMFRAYYFGQVIYFTRSSRLEAVAAFATLAMVGALSLLLIPPLGAIGAAFAFAGGQAAACLVLVIGARRAGTPMPLPLPDMAGIAGSAAACGAVIAGIGLMPGGLMPPGQALRLILLAAGALATAWHYDVLGLAGAIRHRLAA